jgi:hypothetical protein
LLLLQTLKAGSILLLLVCSASLLLPVSLPLILFHWLLLLLNLCWPAFLRPVLLLLLLNLCWHAFLPLLLLLLLNFCCPINLLLLLLAVQL